MKIINVCYNNYERRDNMSLNILYEDNHIIVVEKPSGILSQADHTNDIDMLTLIKRYIKERYQKPGNVYLGLVHRLDRMTSGVMVFAKTSKAASRLNEQILKHEFVKKYYVVVKGIVPKTGNLKNYLYKDEQEVKSYVVNENNGKLAELSYQRINEVNGNSLVDVSLKTGRHHQIRVQFAYAGYPLVGDSLYGNDKNKKLVLIPDVKGSYGGVFENNTLIGELFYKSKSELEEYIKENNIELISFSQL